MKHLFALINLKTLIVTIASVISTWLCLRYEVTANFPLTLVATAIIFPIVFSINGAYKRREVALREYASIKAHGMAIYLVCRDWLENPQTTTLETARGLIGGLLEKCSLLFTSDGRDFRENEESVYRQLSELSRFIKHELRGNGLATGEVSRCNQYLSKLSLAFENLKHIYQYRTPTTLRTFSRFFIVMLPIIYGPYFASQALHYSHFVIYVMPVLFSLVLVSLSNIQDHLENPFDQVGEDDIQFNVDLFVGRMYE